MKCFIVMLIFTFLFCSNLPIKFAAWVPADTVPIRLWYLCRWHRDWQAGPPLRGWAMSMQSPFPSLEPEQPWLLPLLLLLPTPSPFSVAQAPAQQHSELLWGMCRHAGVPALPEPSAHMQAVPPIVFPLLTCMLQGPTGLHLPNTNSKIIIEIFQGSNSPGLIQAWSPSEWGPVQWQRLHAHEAGPAIYQASGFELYVDIMRWWGNDGTDMCRPWS